MLDDQNSVHPPPPPDTTTTTQQQPSSKPRSSKPSRPRSPSPSPPPPLPPLPLQTIRLDIKLGGPDNYEVDIASIARATGQRPSTPPPATNAAAASSDSEGDNENEPPTKPVDGATDGAVVKKVKKKKKSAAAEYYDVSDPFIDDSELAIDERTYFAQTKQQGFYVSSGEVALLKDKTPSKKPKSKKGPPNSARNAATTLSSSNLNPNTGTVKASSEGDQDDKNHAGPSTLPRPATSNKPVSGIKQELGTRDTPIALVSDGESGSEGGKGDDSKTGEKRKRYVTVIEGGKRRKIVDVHSFHPDLQASIEEIKALIAKESFAQKGKFPPSLKPPVHDLAVQAIKLNEYDDAFFALMPQLFPYNRFTMSKLIKRSVFSDHVAVLVARQDALLEELREEVVNGRERAEEEWAKSVVAWDKRQEKARQEAAASGNDLATPAAALSMTDSAAPTRHPTEEMDVDEEGGGGGGGTAATPAATAGASGKDKEKGGADRDQHPPAKKYRLTEKMKNIVWQLVVLSNECCRLENEKNNLENSVLQVSEQGLRKVLYQKIVAVFPEGWMSSGQISRDVSAMKKKLEKEAMENE